MNLFDLATDGVPEDVTPAAQPLAQPVQPRSFSRPDFDGAFDAAAREYGVDADILRSMAYTESRFNPDAVSPKGATGVMQFMPGTAKRYGINPKDPIESIFGAAAYLRDILEKHGGDYEKAVAGYNWGESRKAFGKDNWKDSAPTETRNYIESVLGMADYLKANKSQPLPQDVTPSAAGAGRGVVNPTADDVAASSAKAVPEMIPAQPRDPGLLDQVGDTMNSIRDFAMGRSAHKKESVLQDFKPEGFQFDFKKSSETARKIQDQQDRMDQFGTASPIVGPKPSASSIASGVANSFSVGGQNTIAGIKQIVGDMTGDQVLLSQAGRDRARADVQEANTTPEFESDTAKGVYSGLTSMVRQMPSLMLGVATGNPELALIGMVAPMLPEEYGKFRQQGVDPLHAGAAALATTATEYLTEKLPMATFVNKFGKSGMMSFAKEMLAKEIPGEQIATLVQDAIDTAEGDPSKTWSDYLNERPGAAYQTLVATVVQGAIMSGANRVASGPAAPAPMTAEHLAASKGFLTPQPAPVVPTVEEQPTTPVAPALGAAALGKILKREGLIDEQKAPEAAATQAEAPNAPAEGAPAGAEVRPAASAESVPAADTGSTKQSAELTEPTTIEQSAQPAATAGEGAGASRPTQTYAQTSGPVATPTLSPKAQDLQTRMRQAQNGAYDNTSTASTPLDSTAQSSSAGAQPADRGGRANPVAQASGAPDGQLAAATKAGSGTPAQAGRVPLQLAPQADKDSILRNQMALKRQKGVVVQPVDESHPLTYEQRVVSHLVANMGKTLTWMERSSGPANEMPDGWINSFSGKHIFLDANSTKPLLEVVIHEGTHGLPEHIRGKLRDFVNSKVSAEGRAQFLAKYNYANNTKGVQDEEVLAYVAQNISRKPEFLQDLKTALGNKDFSAFVAHILSKFKELMGGKGRSEFDSEFLGKHVKDVAEVHQRLVEAYAQSMQEQGLQPDAALVEGEMAFAKKAIDVGGYRTTQNKDGSMTVHGDAAEIRAMLPDGVVGRATKGGLQFTHSDAPRVRHALEGNKTAYSRAGAVNEKLALDSDGNYLGAPEKFNTPGKIPHLRKWLMKLTKEGEAGRYWYENSSKAVMRMVGGDMQEARKFVALLAIYSPQAKVDTNSTFALRAWSQYKAGKPISVKTGVMDQKAQRALDDVDEFWSGEKTGNFFTNLLSEIDPATRGKQGATIDMWMMRAAQYASDAPTKTQYAFMENETNRIARDLGWEPQQVQAAIWVAMKARMENDKVKKDTEAKSEKKGWIHYSYPLKNGKPQKTRVVDKAQEHRDNWLAHAIAHDPSTVDTQRAKFDFEDGLRRHIGQVSWEARPGRSTGVLPGVNDAPYDQQVEFQQAVQKALLGPNGEDLLAQKLGLLMDGEDILAPGVWQGEVAAGMQKLVAMAPAKGDDGKTALDSSQKQALDTYSAVLGLLLRQEGVGWHRPFYSGKASGENGVEIRIGRPFTPDEAAELWKAVDSRMKAQGVANWEQGAGMISSPDGMRVVNFGALEENKQFKALVAEAIGDLSIPDPHLKDFTSDGNLVTNDWKAGPNGEDFVSHIRDSGRSDLLGWSRDVLATRVQRVFEDFSEKYNWGDPGTIAFSNKADSDGQRGVYGEGRPSSDPHSVDLTGIHFSQQARSSLLGAYNGTGLKGAELKRLAESTDSRIKSRVYFYVDEGRGITPESGVGGVAHKADIKNLYNVAGDPLKLFRANDLNGSEGRVLDAGYNGYYFPNYVNGQGIAIVLGKAADRIPVTLSGYEKGKAPEVAPTLYKRGLTSKELNAIDMGAVQAVAPSAKLRMGTLSMDQEDLPAARAELAKQGIDIPDSGPAFSNKSRDLDQDVVLTIPVEGGGTAKLTVNAQQYIKQLDAREDALRMVKECMA